MFNDSPEERQKIEWNDGEFASFLAEITPSLEHSVGRLGVAGALGARTPAVDPEKLILSWPEVTDRICEELG